MQSVSHNLIKYTQKVPFLDIQNQKPRVRLMPPSVGRNARGGFNFGCKKGYFLIFFKRLPTFLLKTIFLCFEAQ